MTVSDPTTDAYTVFANIYNIDNIDVATVSATEVTNPDTLIIAVVEPLNEAPVAYPQGVAIINSMYDVMQQAMQQIIWSDNQVREIKMFALVFTIISSFPIIICDLFFAYDKSLCIYRDNKIFIYLVGIGYLNIASTIYVLFEIYFSDINDNLQITIFSKKMSLRLRKFINFIFRLLSYIWSFIGIIIALTSMKRDQCGKSVYVYVVWVALLRILAGIWCNVVVKNERQILI